MTPRGLPAAPMIPECPLLHYCSAIFSFPIARSTGKRYEQAEAQAAHEAALLEPVRKQYEAVTAAVGAALDAAQKLETVEHIDPYAALPAAELARAGALLPFVDTFVTNAKITELADRLVWVNESGSPVSS